jgi:hypothetical protein
VSISKEFSDSATRFKSYIDRLIALLQDHRINSVSGLKRAYQNDEAFSAEWKAIWANIATADGGKISLTTAGVVLGASLGGVGIVAMGGGIGLSLAVVLGLSGLIAGAEVDSVRGLARTKLHFLRLPKPLHARIAETASEFGISENALMTRVLADAFPDPADAGQ